MSRTLNLALVVVSILSSAGAVKAQARLLDNGSAIVYALPAPSEVKRKAEGAARTIGLELAQKGLQEVVGKGVPLLATKLGGFVLSVVTSIPGAGAATGVDVKIASDGSFSTSVRRGRPFAPLVIITPGTNFNAGVKLILEHKPGVLKKWRAVETRDLVSFRELNGLLQRGRLRLARPFLVAPRKPFRVRAKGKYRVRVVAWSSSEGRSSTTLRVR